MADDWKDITDETAQLVIWALADDRRQWRTVDGLARSTGLDTEVVRRVLRAEAPIISTSSTSTTDGNGLCTLKSRYYDRKGPVSTIRDIFSLPSGSSSSSWLPDPTKID